MEFPMPACQCCGSEVRRIQAFRLEYPGDASIYACPNCFSECLANARALRAIVGRVAFMLAVDGVTLDGVSAETVADRLRAET